MKLRFYGICTLGQRARGSAGYYIVREWAYGMFFCAVEFDRGLGLVSRECPNEISRSTILFSVLIVVIVIFIIVILSFVVLRPLANLLDFNLGNALGAGELSHLRSEQERIGRNGLIIGRFSYRTLTISMCSLMGRVEKDLHPSHL